MRERRSERKDGWGNKDKQTPLQQPDPPPSPTSQAKPQNLCQARRPYSQSHPNCNAYKCPEMLGINTVLCSVSDLILAHVLQSNCDKLYNISTQGESKNSNHRLKPSSSPTAKKGSIRPIPNTPGSKHNTSTTAQHKHLQTTIQPPVGTYHNHPLFITS